MDNLEKDFENLNVRLDSNTGDVEDPRISQLLEQLNRALLKQENFSKWFHEEHVSDLELNAISEKLSIQAEEFAQRKDENESDVKYGAIEIFSKRCIQAQINILRKDFDEATKHIVEAIHFLDECIALYILCRSNRWPGYLTGP